MKRFFLLTLLALTNHWATSQTTLTMLVHEEPQSCQRMVPQTCLQVKIDGANEWELFYDKIYGFDYQAGYRYEIKVIRTERPEPVPADLSKYIYKLDKIISKNAVAVSSSVTTWKVVRLNGKTLASEGLNLGFNAEKTEISGKSGCNGFFGGVVFNKKNTKLTIQTVATTLMACSEEAMKLEHEFTTALSNKTFKLKSKGGLWIWSHKGKELLALEAQVIEKSENNAAKPERKPMDYFNGKELKVIQLKGENIQNAKAVLTFDQANNRFFGNNGCNQINGGFSITGNKIRFYKVMSTKMACLDEPSQNMEKGMMAVINTEDLTVDFAEQVMNLYDSSGKLILMLAVSK